MTIKEKLAALSEFCEAHPACAGCPLFSLEHAEADCFETNASIEKNYEIVFGNAPDHDNVNHPAHYETGKFECIDVMVETQGVETVKAYCLCAAFQYLYRHSRKNGVEDIKKAQWYIDKFLELNEPES